jgi:hypothetical protein
MKAKESKSHDEPMGIVISGMPGTPAAPVFAAYVWGPAPTAEEEPKVAV